MDTIKIGIAGLGRHGRLLGKNLFDFHGVLLNAAFTSHPEVAKAEFDISRKAG